MARRVVFDPTERELFHEQRQGFDWTLLQSGFVFRYATRFQLDSACTRLTDLGYLVHELEGGLCLRREDPSTIRCQSLLDRNAVGKVIPHGAIHVDVEDRVKLSKELQ